MDDPVPRQRGTKKASGNEGIIFDEPLDEDKASLRISALDVSRIILALLISTLALSYYVYSGESVLWGYRPWITRPGLVKAFWRGPVQLTPVELALYNGTNPSIPIYLAINGTIFDVTVGAHTYGPGGSYHIFAGRDATRAFVSGCFREDLTNDLRGLDEMYIPVDDENETISSRERKLRTEQDRRQARKKVHKEVQRWEDFYRNSQKYFEVGRVVGAEKHEGPVPQLCEAAASSRPSRKAAVEEERPEGKPV